MLYERILNECKRLEEKINLIKSQIDSLPEGTLICSKNGNHVKCYIQDAEQKRYLNKKETKLIEDLALKKYYSSLLQDYIHERMSLSLYLKHHEMHVNKVSQLLTHSGGYQCLLSPNLTSLPENLKEWVNAPYDRNQKYPEQLIHKSISGNTLRSKSESLIDMLLYQNQIPFRYENPLIIDNTTFYPDFTTRHPQTGEVVYWEHFGMMDNPTYAKNAYAKLQFYTSNGLIPTIHVITTFETTDHPLTSDLVQQIIDYYFT